MLKSKRSIIYEDQGQDIINKIKENILEQLSNSFHHMATILQ